MAAPKNDKPIVVYVLDFETGGLDCRESAITQIAIHAVQIDTFETIGSYVSYVYPYYKKELKKATPKRKVLKSKYEAEDQVLMEYADRALKYSAITMDMLYQQGKPIEQVADEVLQFMADMAPVKTAKNKKPVVVGQNIGFDEGFLCQMFEYVGKVKELSDLVRGTKDFYGNWHPQLIDTIHMGQLALSNNPQFNSFKLELMCDALGVDLVDAHDADADVAATANLLGVLTQRMRCSNGTSDDSIKFTKAEKSRKHFKI